MNERIWQVVLTVLGGVITGAIGLYTGWLLNRCQRSRSAKDDFRIFVNSKINQIPEKDILVFYLTVKSEVGTEIEKLNLFLWRRGQKRVDAAWNLFGKIDFGKLKDENEAEWKKDLRKSLGSKEIPERPSDVLRFHFNKLIAATR